MPSTTEIKLLVSALPCEVECVHRYWQGCFLPSLIGLSLIWLLRNHRRGGFLIPFEDQTSELGSFKRTSEEKNDRYGRFLQGKLHRS